MHPNAELMKEQNDSMGIESSEKINNFSISSKESALTWKEKRFYFLIKPLTRDDVSGVKINNKRQAVKELTQNFIIYYNDRSFSRFSLISV